MRKKKKIKTFKKTKTNPKKKRSTLSSLEEQPFQDWLLSQSINFRSSEPTETAPQDSKNELTTTHKSLHNI